MGKLLPSKLVPLSVKQMLELDACVKCECCKDECPVYLTSKEDPEVRFPPSYGALIRSFKSLLGRKYGLLSSLGLHPSKSSLLGKLFKGPPTHDELLDFSKEIFNCTTCGRCYISCPLAIRTYELGVSMREWLVREGAYPDAFNLLKDAVSKTRNIWNMPNEERAAWADYAYSPVKIYGREGRGRADTLLYVGCVGAFSSAVQDVLVAAAEVLNRAGEDYLFLGPEEWCCGYPLWLAGMGGSYLELLKHNVEMVSKVGARRVVFVCPSCYEMWAKKYRPYIPQGVKLMHMSELICEYIKRGAIRLGRLDLKVTYHDPCDLGRKLGVYDAPRLVIKSIPGVVFKELKKSRQFSVCCGGGGDVQVHQSNVPVKVSKLRIEEVRELGVDALVSACLQCKRTFISGVQAHGGEFRVMDVAELVLESMQSA